jgi:hypothetical protein
MQNQSFCNKAILKKGYIAFLVNFGQGLVFATFEEVFY